MRRGRIAVLVAALLLGAVGFTAYYVWSLYNPCLHGKRLYAWIDQGLHDPDSTARSQAADVLCEALPRLHDDYLWMFLWNVQVRATQPPGSPLPREMNRVLIEALAYMPGSYPQATLVDCAGPDTARDLAVAVRTHPNPTVRWCAARTLGHMGHKAAGAIRALRGALGDEDPKVRESAGEALASLGHNPEP
jgi:hypothetical protein